MEKVSPSLKGRYNVYMKQKFNSKFKSYRILGGKTKRSEPKCLYLLSVNYDDVSTNHNYRENMNPPYYCL